MRDVYVLQMFNIENVKKLLESNDLTLSMIVNKTVVMLRGAPGTTYPPHRLNEFRVPLEYL